MALRATLALALVTLAVAYATPCEAAAASARVTPRPPRCSCVSQGPPRVAQAEASAVLLVRITSVDAEAVTVQGGGRTYPGRVVTAEVEAAWPAGSPIPDSSGHAPSEADAPTRPQGRGPRALPATPAFADSVVVLRTGEGGGDCGYHFRIGERYLVYALGPVEALETSICSRTRRARQARADLAALGPPVIDRRRRGRS